MIRKRSSLIAALMVLAMILSYLPTVTVFAANEVREGLVIGWPDWDEKGEPHFVPDKEEMSNGLGMDSAHTNYLTIGWADAKGSITPLSYGDLDYLSISYADGKATDYYLNLAMDTRYIEEEDQWILDTKEQGIFDIGIPLPGEYILTYSGPESRGMDADWIEIRAEYICHHYWYDAKNDEWIEDGRDEQEKTFPLRLL